MSKIFYKVSEIDPNGEKTPLSDDKYKDKEKPTNSNGYVWLYLPDHPNSFSNEYYYEHRYVVEKYIGRYLRDDELVIHRDGDKTNNKITNLMLFEVSDSGDLTQKKMTKHKNKEIENLVRKPEPATKAASYRVKVSTVPGDAKWLAQVIMNMGAYERHVADTSKLQEIYLDLYGESSPLPRARQRPDIQSYKDSLQHSVDLLDKFIFSLSKEKTLYAQEIEVIRHRFERLLTKLKTNFK